MYSYSEEAKSVLLVRFYFILFYFILSLFRFSVPHDRLFLDALERDLKREKAGLEPTTVVTGPYIPITPFPPY